MLVCGSDVSRQQITKLAEFLIDEVTTSHKVRFGHALATDPQ